MIASLYTYHIRKVYRFKHCQNVSDNMKNGLSEKLAKKYIMRKGTTFILSNTSDM
jgi:hypothetical protein